MRVEEKCTRVKEIHGSGNLRQGLQRLPCSLHFFRIVNIIYHNNTLRLYARQQHIHVAQRRLFGMVSIHKREIHLLGEMSSQRAIDIPFHRTNIIQLQCSPYVCRHFRRGWTALKSGNSIRRMRRCKICRGDTQRSTQLHYLKGMLRLTREKNKPSKKKLRHARLLQTMLRQIAHPPLSITAAARAIIRYMNRMLIAEETHTLLLYVAPHIIGILITSYHPNQIEQVRRMNTFSLCIVSKKGMLRILTYTRDTFGQDFDNHWDRHWCFIRLSLCLQRYIFFLDYAILPK